MPTTSELPSQSAWCQLFPVAQGSEVGIPAVVQPHMLQPLRLATLVEATRAHRAISCGVLVDIDGRARSKEAKYNRGEVL